MNYNYTYSAEQTYYYAHNWRGDVVALYDSTGSLFATYDYDAWGKVLRVSDANGNLITSTTNFANINPFRYRGYYYDTDSKLYYLQSRYYDPVTGRFVNADDVICDSYIPSVINSFTYCGNNGINAFDNDGHSFDPYYVGECMGHYFTNKNIRITGYIYNQQKGNASRLKIGYSNTAKSGCGWVATYNALLMLGKYIAPCDIIHSYEMSGAIVGGLFGINPYAVINYFFYKGYRVSVTYNINKFDAQAKRNKANILVYTHSNGGHYIALKWNGRTFIGYNTYSNSAGPDNLGRYLIPFFTCNKAYNYKPIMLISIS